MKKTFYKYATAIHFNAKKKNRLKVHMRLKFETKSKKERVDLNERRWIELACWHWCYCRNLFNSLMAHNLFLINVRLISLLFAFSSQKAHSGICDDIWCANSNSTVARQYFFVYFDSEFSSSSCIAVVVGFFLHMPTQMITIMLKHFIISLCLSFFPSILSHA